MANIVDRIKARFATRSAIDTNPISANPRGLVQDYRLDGWNLDQLVRLKGGAVLGLKIYREMRRHASIRPLLNQKKNDVISAGWRVEPASAEKIDQIAADFVTWNLNNLQGPFSQTVRQLFTALEFGYAVSEKLYAIADDGPYRGNIYLSKLATRVPENFRFKIQTDGTLENNEITQMIPQAQLPADKFVIYSFNREFDNWYGESDLRAAYEPYFSLNVIQKFWNMYLERYGIPTVIGKYPRGTDETSRTTFETMLKRIQGSTAITIPADLEFELHEIMGRGYQAFKEACDKREAQLTKVLGFPQETGMGQAGEKGSRARAQVQARGFLPTVLILVEDLEAVFNEQIIPELVAMNYAVEVPPTFHVNDLAFEDTSQNVNGFLEAVKVGVVHPRPEDEVYTREALGYPAIELSELEAAEEERAAVADELRDRLANAPPPADDQSDEEPPAPTDQQREKFAAGLMRKPNAIEAKVDWFVVAADMDAVEESAIERVGKIVAKMRDDVIASIERRNLVAQKKSGDVNKLQLKHKGDLRIAFREALVALYESGKKQAKKEVGAKFKDWQPLTPTEALKFFDAKAFTMTGVEEDYILKQVKLVVFNGIKMGKTMADVSYDIRQVFKPYFETGEMVDEQLRSAHRLETVIRTNGNEAYNQGRLEIYRESGSDIVPAVMFSAILDERTTEVCRALDGKVFEVDDPALGQFTPPMHMNCRSTLVPVVTGEQYEVISDKEKGAALDLTGAGFK